MKNAIRDTGLVLAVAAVLALVTTLIAGGAPASAAPKIKVRTTAADPLAFAGIPATLAPGKYVFVYRNRSGMTHDLEVADRKTPLFDSGTRRLRVTLAKGVVHYECTVPGHAAAGMKGRIRVR